ncbi:MAG: murein transglycosylase, partial [Candidatus Limnocylindria bacterium]
MAPARRASAWRRIGSTVLAATLLVGLGAIAAYSLGRADLGLPFGGRIPLVAYDAYRSAEDAAPTVTGSCAVDWPIVAGIAQVESRHGRLDDHHLDADGNVERPIRGRQLDGTRGTQTIVDTDEGALDGDSEWDRAMGPLQFIPTTWRELGRDGNGDGSADPDNLYDA